MGTSIGAPSNESARSLILGEWFPAWKTGNGGDHSWWQSVHSASGTPPVPFTVSGADREAGPSILDQPRGHIPRVSPSKKAVPYPTTLRNG